MIIVVDFELNRKIPLSNFTLVMEPKVENYWNLTSEFNKSKKLLIV